MLNIEKLKLWYPKFWNKKMMANAVKKCAITTEQYKEITGEDYPAAPNVGAGPNQNAVPKGQKTQPE